MQGFKAGEKLKAQHLADGGTAKGFPGKIRGPGTGTSDSIAKKVPVGSFIVPADSVEAIGEKSLDGLGFKPGKVPVNVSNGEYELPPEQVHAIGVQVLDQMRDATHTPAAAQGAGFKPQHFFADGGEVDPTKKRPGISQANILPDGNPDIKPANESSGVHSPTPLGQVRSGPEAGGARGMVRSELPVLFNNQVGFTEQQQPTGPIPPSMTGALQTTMPESPAKMAAADQIGVGFPGFAKASTPPASQTATTAPQAPSAATSQAAPLAQTSTTKPASSNAPAAGRLDAGFSATAAPTAATALPHIQSPEKGSAAWSEANGQLDSRGFVPEAGTGLIRNNSTGAVTRINAAPPAPAQPQSGAPATAPASPMDAAIAAYQKAARSGNLTELVAARGALKANMANPRAFQSVESLKADDASRKRLDEIQQSLLAEADPNSEKYKTLLGQYQLASGRQVRDPQAGNRFTVVPGGQEWDGQAGAMRNVPARVLNNQTGQFVDQAPRALPPIAQNPEVIKIMNNTALSKDERAKQIRALGYQ